MTWQLTLAVGRSVDPRFSHTDRRLCLAPERMKGSMTFPMENGRRPAARLGHEVALVSLCCRHHACAHGACLIAGRWGNNRVWKASGHSPAKLLSWTAVAG